MKKGLYALASVLALTMLAGCSADEPTPGPGDGEVTFTVQLPEEAVTRAIGDGSAANTLYYAIYDVDAVASSEADAKVYLINRAVTTTGLTTTIHEKLVPGRTYKVAFWATNSDSPYTFNPNTMQVTTDASKLKAGSDNNDGFVGSIASFSVAGGFSTKVELKRPFAQINLGTDDFAALKELGMTLDNLQCEMVVKGVYTTLDVMTGNVTGTRQNLTFQMAPCPDGDFPQAGYDYLSDAYVMLPSGQDSQDIVTVGFVTNETTLESATWDNVPAKRNMRTNIYGSLLTNPTDITVNINPEWLPSFDPTPWDGSTVTTPTINEKTKMVMLTKASDIAGLAQMVNAGDDLSGYTVMLTGDADLGGQNFPMIGSVTRSGTGITSDSKPMRGNFNGNNHTIKNLKLNYPGSGKEYEDQVIGFIGNLEGGTVSNVSFENVTLDATGSKFAGTAVGLITNGGTVNNVHVTSGNLTFGSGGGVVGRIIKSGTITGCSNAATITGSIANLGGITAAAYYTAPGQVMTISGCTNTGNITSTAGGVAGGIVGLSCANVSNCENSGEIKATRGSVGGIVGEQQNYGTIDGCTNTGTVTFNTDKDVHTVYGYGGIVGWIRYSGDTGAYSLKGIITVKNCKNSAVITGANNAGGIIGTAYWFAIVTNNTNTATKIQAYNFAAGIVGNYQQDGSYNGITPPANNADWCQILNNTTSTPLVNMTIPGTSNPTPNRKLICFYNNGLEYLTISGNVDGNGNPITNN